MTRILTHRGLDPSKNQYFVESSYEAFQDQLLRGYGLELDIQFTKDGEIVILHDSTLMRLSEGSDQRAIKNLTRAEIMDLSFRGCHITDFDQLFKLFSSLRRKDVMLALHCKGKIQDPDKKNLEILLKKLQQQIIPFSEFFLFDLTPDSAAFLKSRQPQLQLAASVSHPYDIERYNSYAGGTLLTMEEAIQHKTLYEWVWLDEWDLTATAGKEKMLYSHEIFQQAREHRFRIALVTPELHASSPGLLGSESHPDGTDDVKLHARFKKIVELAPDLICTDYPDFVYDLVRNAAHTSLI